MAKPCNYQLAGEDTWMSESDFKQRLNEGLLDKLLIDNNIKIPGIKPVKESAPRAVEQTAPSSSVAAQEREAAAVDARKSIPKQFNEGYVEVEGKEKGKAYKGYSIKVNEGNKTADIKLPNGKEMKNQPILQFEGLMADESPLYVRADGGTSIRIPSQAELDAKAEKQAMVEEEKKATKENRDLRRKNIDGFEELESKAALDMAKKLRFSPNEFTGDEIIGEVEGLTEFDEKVTVNGKTYGTDKNKSVTRVIEKLEDSKQISAKEAEILQKAFDAKKDAYWRAKNNKTKEDIKDKIDKMAEELKKPKGTKSTINPFDFLPQSIKNKAIDLFRDLLKKGVDASFAFREAVYNAMIPEIQAGRMTIEEGNELETKMLENLKDARELDEYTEIEMQRPDLRTQVKYRTEAQKKMTRELTKKRPKNNEELTLLARQFMNDGLIEPKRDIIDPVISGERDLYMSPLNEIEQAILRLYGRDLEDSMTEVNRKSIKAVQEGKPTRIYDDERAKIESDITSYVDVMLDDSLITGRLFSFRRELETSRMTFEEMMIKAQSKATNSNGILSEETKQKFKDIADKFAEVERQLKIKEAEVMNAAENEAVQNIVDDVNENGADVEPETKNIKEKAKKIAENLRRNKIHRPGMFLMATPGSLAFDAAVEAAATAIEASGSVINAVNKALQSLKNGDWYKSLSDEKKEEAEKQLSNYIKGYSGEMISSSDGSLKIPMSLVRNLVASGVDTIEGLVDKVREELEFTNPELSFTDRQIRDAITGYGNFIKPPKSELVKKIADLKSVGRMISTLEDLRNGIRKSKKPAEVKELKEQERYLKGQIRAILNTIPVSAEDEIIIRNSRLNALKNERRNRIDELERAKAEGRRPERRRRAQPVSDATTERLQNRIDELEDEINQFPYTEEELEEIEAQRLKQYKNTQRRAIKELERKLKEGDFSKKTPKSLELDEEATELRNRRQRLRDEFEAEVEAIELKNRGLGIKIIDTIVGSVNDLKSLSLSGDIGAFRQGGFIMADLILSDPKTVGLFIKRIFTLAGIVPKTNPVTNPKKFAKELVNSLVDEDNGKKLYDALELDRKQSGDYELMKKSGLFLQEETQKLSQKAEGVAVGIVKKIPLWGEPLKIKGKTWVPGLDIMGRGERSFSAINELRTTTFMQGVRRLREAGFSFEKNPDAYKAWARHVNTMSGRGVGGNHKLGRAFEALAPILNTFFVSARFLKSRFDLSLLNPYGIYKIAMLPRPLKLLAFRQVAAANAYMAGTTYIAYLVLGATLAALGKDDEDEEGYEVFTGESTEEEDKNAWELSMDIFSSDFAKLTKGDVSVDFLAGLSQTNVFIAREAPYVGGKKTMKDGEVVKLNSKFNGPTYGNVAGNFLMSKMVPWAQAGVRYLIDTRKEEEEGVPSEPSTDEASKKKIEDYFLPLSVILARDLAKQKNLSVSEKIALNALSFLGIGNANVSSFGKKEEKGGYEVFTGEGGSSGYEVFTGN